MVIFCFILVYYHEKKKEKPTATTFQKFKINYRYRVINYKGNWLATILNNFLMNKDKFTTAGFEPWDLRIDVLALYQLS